MLHAHIMPWSLYRKRPAISIMLVSVTLIYMQIFTYNLGVCKTYNRIQELYYSISKTQVKKVIAWCAICALQAASKGKPPIKLIKVKFCLEQLVIKLIDFQAAANREWKWILNKKELLV